MKRAILHGEIVKGIGEGTFFMSINHYRQEIKNKLGFDPYPGTLNVKVLKDQAKLIKGESKSKIRIEGFQEKKKSYGGATCYKAKIKNISGAIIVPDLTRHKEDIIEFIAPINVKSTLKVFDGDNINLEIK
jgi:riboflavin kinase, archaea type